MKGKYLHNLGMVEPLQLAAVALGARVRVECPVDPGQRPRTVDLLVEWRGSRIAIEPERSLARIANDVEKAETIGAALLLLVFPTPRLAAAASRKLRTLRQNGLVRCTVPVRAMTLGVALHYFRHPELLSRMLPSSEVRPPRSSDSLSSD